jgi:hypothetical protein
VCSSEANFADFSAMRSSEANFAEFFAVSSSKTNFADFLQCISAGILSGEQHPPFLRDQPYSRHRRGEVCSSSTVEIMWKLSSSTVRSTRHCWEEVCSSSTVEIILTRGKLSWSSTVKSACHCWEEVCS